MQVHTFTLPISASPQSLERIVVSPGRQRFALLALAGEVDRFALVAYQVDRCEIFRALEYYLLRRVVHAGLTKIVRWSGAFMHGVGRQNKNPAGKLMKTVLRPLVALALQINEVCFDLSCIVFERLAFLIARREFLLQLKRGVLDVDDAVIESAQRLVNFRVIARLSGSL